MGYWRTHPAQKSAICSEVRTDLSDFLKMYLPLACRKIRSQPGQSQWQPARQVCNRPLRLHRARLQAPLRSISSWARSRLRLRRRWNSRACAARLQIVENLDAHAQSFAETCRADGHNHEFLRIHGIIGVRAAVQNVHHRNGKSIRGSGDAGILREITVERQFCAAAAARAAAIETARIAFAPRLPLFGVPSTVQSCARSSSRLAGASMPRTAAQYPELMLATALSTPLPM